MLNSQIRAWWPGAGSGGMLGRKNSLACRDRELPVQERLDGHTLPTNGRWVGDAWGILASANSFALLSTTPFSKKALPRSSNFGANVRKNCARI